ncbi:o-succinylbenzoate synthase [Dechloromonas sp. XY25]|uniref:O-succinylbenzoate synthase n=1 Tax=Dechloromonas hankyongensis TaxID=2908002 RepID=A0ABS9K2D1_9RHOO|nr:o-succinylbenzoate synthase [Dechloromonas hankyongensis]MCG2577339.1 o-succinylbenzoate synthase [Dechloromonas hankyongensis]
MNIAAADWLPYALPLRRPWRTSRGEIAERGGRLCRLQTVDGLTGWGDSAPLPEFGISTSAADAFAEETAHLDLLAQQAGLPLHQWLSGEAHAGSLAVNGNLGSLSEATPTLVQATADLGYSIVKLKVGVAPVNDEIAHLTQLAAHAPAGVSWRLDANRAWSFADAQAFIARCAHLPIEGLEEPLADPDSASLSRLQAAAAFPLALDESTELIDAHFFRHPPVRRLIIKPARHGGLLASVELALRAQASNIEAIVTSSLESACGLAACAQLAAAVAPEKVHGLATADWFAADTGAVPRIAGGRIPLPTAAGLGFLPNNDYVSSAR